MEPRETFTSRSMRRPNVQTRMPSKVEPPKVKLEGWGDNALKVTLADLQRKEREITNMNLSTQRHGTLYIFEKILHMYQ